MKKHIAGILTGLLVTAFGGTFAVVGWLGMQEVRPYDGGLSATADVVGIVPGSVIIDGIARTKYSPVYEFTAADGERYRITDHATASLRPLEVGSTVEISYRPDDPGSPRRVDVDRDWLWWFVIGGSPVAAFGALGVLASVVAMIRAATRPPQQRGPFVRQRSAMTLR